MKKIKDILTPKKEVLKDKFQSVIHTYKVGEKKEGLENDPKSFFEATYPSNAIKNILDNVNAKLKHKASNGGFVLNGPRGSGKSHALLTLYHLFENFEFGSKWLDNWNIDFRTIEDSQSAIVSTQKIDADYIWEPIFKRLGYEEKLSDINRYPEIGDIEEIIDNNTVAIFLDELETWWKTIKNDEEKKSKNQMFLQNLLEVAKDDDYELFVFLVSYGNVPGLDKTLNRTSPHREDISSSGDKEKAVFHRIFDKEQKENNEEEIRSIIESYVEEYSDPIIIEKEDKFKEDFFDSYPFHPQLLEVVSSIYEGAKERQNIRGEMKALADTVAENYKNTDVILLSDIDEEEFKSVNRKLVNKFEIDQQKRLKDINYSSELLRVILIFSLEDSTSYPNKSDIFLGTFKPTAGMTLQNLEMDLENMVGKAEYLHKENNRYFIKNERNISALIESNKQGIQKEKALEKIRKIVKKDICENKAYIFELEKENIPDDSKGVKYVVCLNQYGEDKKGLQNQLEEFLKGREYRNTIVFIVPSNGNKNLLEDEKVLDKAKTLLAAENLKQKRTERSEDINLRIENEKQELKEYIKNNFGQWVKWFGSGSDLNMRLKPTSLDIAEIKRKVRSDESHIREQVSKILDEKKDSGIKIDKLLDDFRKMRKYPLISDSDTEVFNTTLKNYNGEDWVIIGDRGNKYWDKNPQRIEDNMRIVAADYVSREEEEYVDEVEDISKQGEVGDSEDIEEQIVSEEKTTVKKRKKFKGNSFKSIKSSFEMKTDSENIAKIAKLNLEINLNNLDKEQLMSLFEKLDSEAREYINSIDSEIEIEEYED